MTTPTDEAVEEFLEHWSAALCPGNLDTGGKHRSVAIAAELAARVADAGTDVQVVHRDLGRE